MMTSQSGPCEVVKLLLQMEAIGHADGQNDAALLERQNGHKDVVKLLLAKLAEVNGTTQDGLTGLMWASRNDDSDVLRLILAREAKVNEATQDGATPLMWASQKGYCNAVRLLLEAKAEVNAATQDGVTALIWASQKGHREVVRLLLEGGADVNAAKQSGVTALISASQNDHCDIVKVLLDRKAEVNAATHDGVTALKSASQKGHCDVVKLLLEREADVNAATQDGVTALMSASQKGYCDVVRLLLEWGAKVNAATQDGRTALMLASQKGQWNVAEILIDAGGSVSYISKDGEIAAMYIVFAEISNKYHAQLRECVKNILQNPLSQKSHYAMSSASFALIGSLLYNTTSEWFEYHFAKSALQEDILYAFLPNLVYDYSENDGYLFSTYQGVEGKISLHTLGTAAVCKLPHTTLQWLTTCHRDMLVNMLGQTPLHLLAMETAHTIEHMEKKIPILTETVGFSFSDRDSNGRVPYHIACLCLNAQFLQCGLRLDYDFRSNMLVQDHLGKMPLQYMTFLLSSTNESSGIPSLKLLSATKILNLLSQNIGPSLARNTQLKTHTSLSPSNCIMDSFRTYFKDNMTVSELSDIKKKAKKVFSGASDAASLFKCSTIGIVHLPDRQDIVHCIIYLFQLIGTQMGKMDPLFECVPELKGSIQEYTKSGDLDEIDISMKLVNFKNYFSVHISEDNIRNHANITPICDRYWISGTTDMFASVEFCADFWKLLLKALDTEVTRTYTKSNGFIIENCQRKHGFVGMLNISCQIGCSMLLVSVDIAPSIVSDNLDTYTALLRPRNYDNKEVGRKFYQGLELSSSQKDWDFLKFLQPEVICGYALVKMLRSVAKSFQTGQGRVCTVEDILPSYVIKTALLWILDPEEKYSTIYKDLEINSVFHREHSNSYKDDVRGLCQAMLGDPQSSGLGSIDRATLLDISQKCTLGTGYLSVRERILPYVLATRHTDRQQQNGINLQWMQENWNPYVGDIPHQDEVIYSRTFYKDPEAERISIKHISDNKPVVQMSHHKIAYPAISEETARKCRVWALRLVRLLPHILQYDGWISVGRKSIHIVGVRNYYLPDQEIYARDKGLAVALCQLLESVLE